MKLKKLKIKKNPHERTNLILFLLFCAFTISLSVGYAALNEELKISGEATFRVEEDIRITNVELYETTNLGLENYNNKYSKNTVSLGVDLKQLDSTVTYKVTVVNSGTVSMWIDSITQEINNNTNMIYELEGIGIKELINSGEEITFNLTIKYKDNITLPSNTNLDTMIKFNFIKPTSILAQGNGGDGTTTFFNSGPITKESVESITFQPTLEVGENALGFWDASYNKDMTVIAWYTDNDNNDLYELNIGGIGEVYAPVNSSHLFRSFINIENISFNEYFNTSNVTNMSYMFYNCSSLVTLDVTSFDTSKVTNMSVMFFNCKLLTNLNLSDFDTSGVKSLSYMFYSCSSLTSLDLGHFNTSKVTSMYSMFYGCSSLTELNVSNFDTSQVTNFGYMFYNCSSITTLDISSFNTSKVTTMEWIFNGCSKLESIDVSEFDTSNVTNMYGMFRLCYKLENIDVSGFDTSNVTTIGEMFRSCNSLSELDLTNFNTSQVTSMAMTFLGCSSINNLNLSKFDTSKVTNMQGLFSGCSSLKDLDLSNFNTNKVTNMSNIFHNCYKLTNLDLSNFDTSKVSNMSSMFWNCLALGKLDISSFDFGSVTNNTSMFYNVPKTSLITVKDQTAKDYILNLRSDFNNIQIASEV